MKSCWCIVLGFTLINKCLKLGKKMKELLPVIKFGLDSFPVFKGFSEEISGNVKK